MGVSKVASEKYDVYGPTSLLASFFYVYLTMVTQNDLLVLTILKQREALYQLEDITRTDLEILAFSKQKLFFTLYDVQQFYPHTNVQQIIRSLRKLLHLKYIDRISKGVKGKSSTYHLLTKGKGIIRNYVNSIKS